MATKRHVLENTGMNLDKKFDKFLASVGANIKAARLEAGYTQEEMCQFGFNYRHYQRVESGKHAPSLHTLFRIAEALGIEVEDLLFRR